MAFFVKVGGFEGPLEVLLDLIEKRKLLINEVSLARVADDFLGYVKNFPAYPLEETAQFILIASTLLLIKSRSLLPALALSEAEEASVEDLEMRLRLYKTVRDLSREILSRFGETYLEEPLERREDESVFAPDKRTAPERFRIAIEGLLRSLPTPARLTEKMVEKIVSLEDMVKRLGSRIEKTLFLSFREFSAGHANRKEVIVSFLAMLELIKQGLIAVEQRAHFDDIVMEKSSIGTPSYGR